MANWPDDYQSARQVGLPAREAFGGHDGVTGFSNSRSAELGFIKKSPKHLGALSRVREWTRKRFKLSEQTSILVSEIACRLPGCPPLETVIAFWVDDRRYHFKVFKAVAEIHEEDLPPTWLMQSLAVPQGFERDCC